RFRDQLPCSLSDRPLPEDIASDLNSRVTVSAEVEKLWILEPDQKKQRLFQELTNLSAWSSSLGESKSGRRLTLEVLVELGYACNDRGQRHEALKAYEQALQIAEELDDRYHIANIFTLIGLVHDDMGQRARALAYHERSLPIQEEIGDRAGIARTLSNLALVH